MVVAEKSRFRESILSGQNQTEMPDAKSRHDQRKLG